MLIPLLTRAALCCCSVLFCLLLSAVLQGVALITNYAVIALVFLYKG